MQNMSDFLPKGNYIVTTIDDCSETMHPEWDEYNQDLVDASGLISDKNPVVISTSKGQTFAVVDIGPDSMGIKARTVTVSDKAVLVDEHELFEGFVQIVILPVNDTTSQSEYYGSPDVDDYAYITLDNDSLIILANGTLTIGDNVIDIAKPGCIKTVDGVIVDMAEPGIAQAYGYADAEDSFDEHGMMVVKMNDKLTPAIRKSFQDDGCFTLYYARRPVVNSTPSLALAA